MIKICRTVISPVLYGCEIWSFTQREELTLRIFDNRMVMKIFGLTREAGEIT